MAVRCRIISGKSFCVNYLLSSSRSNHFLDSSKFYHHSNDKHTCNIKKDGTSVMVVPFCEKFEQHLQLPMSFSPSQTCKTLHQSHPSFMVSSRFSSHVLMNQDNPLTSLSKVENPSVLPSDVVNIEESKKSNSPAASDKPDSSGRPSKEQVEEIFQMLSQKLPLLFVQSLDYKHFAGDIIIEDNLRNRRSVGLVQLINKLAGLRVYAHLKFAYVKLHVLKITSHPEEGCIKVRWRIVGITTFRAMFTFWKVKLWKLKDSLKKEEEVWNDGFSIVYVNGDGKISKVIIDKMMPDQENKVVKDDKISLAARLAMVGITPEALNSLALFKWSSGLKCVNGSKNVSSVHHSCRNGTSLSSDYV